MKGDLIRTAQNVGREKGRLRAAEHIWLMALPLSFLVLLWTSRNAPLGTAVCDDYAFLYRLTFHRPPDWFDSMGAAFYWRPLSRQLYFTLVGPWMLQFPWVAAAVNATLLLAIAFLLHRIARHFVSVPVATAVAVFPLLSEPARVLLGWPSGAQHLLSAAAVLLAMHEVLSGRLMTAALAALGGLLSHESAVLVLPMLPLVTWMRTRRLDTTGRAAAITATVAAAWGIGYALALRHGVRLPASSDMHSLAHQLPSLYGHAVIAALNLEDISSRSRLLLMCGYMGIVMAAVVLLATRSSRLQFAQLGPALFAADIWFALGLLPLVMLLPDWNAWRAWIPTLGFAVGTTALLGLVSPWLAAGWVTLKLVALLVSPTAGIAVSNLPPTSASHDSFAQIARLQRLASATRRVLLQHDPAFPRHASVCFVRTPFLAEYGLAGDNAIRVWYRDSTLEVQGIGEDPGLVRPFAAGIEFLPGESEIAMPIDADALWHFQLGLHAITQSDLRAADSLLVLTERDQERRKGTFLGAAIYKRGRIALLEGRLTAADSLNRVAESLGITPEDHWAFEAQLALRRGDRPAALAALQQLAEVAPDSPDASEVASRLGLKRIR